MVRHVINSMDADPISYRWKALVYLASPQSKLHTAVGIFWIAIDILDQIGDINLRDRVIDNRGIDRTGHRS